MDTSYTRSSNSSDRSGTVPRTASPDNAPGEEGQGMQTFRDDASLLTLIQPQTRVMSPTVGTPPGVWDLELLPQGMISQVVREGTNPTLQCQVCGGVEKEFYVCSGCHKIGHYRCLSVSMVGGYAFCNDCATSAITQYGKQVTEHQKTESHRIYAQQMAAWKEAAVHTTGVAGTVGLTIGSGISTVVHGTAALAR